MAPTCHAPCCPRFRQRLADAPGLPFADQRTADEVERAHGGAGLSVRDRLFTPLVTLWVFLTQVLDPDPSCRAAVARFLAWRAARGLAPCSANTGAYCHARSRLPESARARRARDAGRRTQERAASGWRWHDRTVQVVDGTTVSLPDTPKNQAAFPQSGTQAVGVGFPLARLVVLFSLAVGTTLDAALGRYLGKQTGEQALVRTMQEGLEADDVLLADRGFSSYWEIAWARQRGADMVCRMHPSRHCDFRRGCRLGPEDHVVVWTRPLRPDWMDKATYAATPRTLTIREARVRVTQPGFRTRVLLLATTLLDAAEYPRGAVAVLYRLR